MADAHSSSGQYGGSCDDAQSAEHITKRIRITAPSMCPTADMKLCVGDTLCDVDMIDHLFGDDGSKQFLKLAIRNKKGNFCAWAKSLGLASWGCLPRKNVLSEISDFVRAQRGKPIQKFRRTNRAGGAQHGFFPCIVRRDPLEPILVGNLCWPIQIEMSVPNLNWILKEIYSDMEKHDGDRFDPVTNWKHSATASDGDSSKELSSSTNSKSDGSPSQLQKKISSEVARYFCLDVCDRSEDNGSTITLNIQS